MIYWCDGSGWNGAFACFFVLSFEGKAIFRKTREKRTNNEMEYEAVVKALELCEDGDTIFSDSQLVVKQLMGSWEISAEKLVKLNRKANELLEKKPNVKLLWIKRDVNLAGIELEIIRKRINR